MKTPGFLVNRRVLEQNIKKVQSLCNDHHKKLCPMTKTHKSIEIAEMQIKAGANELLVGTVDEAKAFEHLGVGIVFAYPIVNLDVLHEIKALECDYMFSVDNKKHLEILLDQGFEYREVLVIVNSGLNRLGVNKEDLLELIQEIDSSGLIFKGLATHAGQVYKEHNYEGVQKVANQEYNALKDCYDLLVNHGYSEFEVCTGTTPTFFELVSKDIITTFRPGNYVYNDAIQIALGVCDEGDIALSVLATVISNPEKDKYILDVGSKCLGLDKGAHGNQAIKGHGVVRGVDGEITSLSEEVAILETWEPLSIGNTLVIIPNHACSTNNMTSRLYDFQNDSYIKIDARSNQ